MSVHAVRISKTSAQSWTLHGPIDQALKTTIQADAVKVCPLKTIDHHGLPVELELWVNAQDASLTEGQLNYPAITILMRMAMIAHGLTIPDTMAEAHELMGNPELQEIADTVPSVNGPAILTGVGGTDVPQHHLGCLVAELLGQPEGPELPEN